MNILSLFKQTKYENERMITNLEFNNLQNIHIKSMHF